MENPSNSRDAFLHWALKISRILRKAMRDTSLDSARRCVVSEIVANLALACNAIESIPIYWIEPEVHKMCQILLDDFADINSYRKAYWKFTAISHDCSHLAKLIAPNNEGDGDGVRATYSQRPKTHFIDFTRDLFKALEIHIKCELDRQDYHKSHAWHPARLCLIEEEHDSPSISLLISPMQMAYWQDFHLVVTVVDDNTDSQPAFCNLVDTQYCARVEVGFDVSKGQFRFHRNKFLKSEAGSGHGESLADVLRERQLMPKEKVILAYTIAQAFYHFYDSDLMRIKWTSEAIWFMPPTTGKDEIPLRPYLIFPSGIPDDPEEDFVDNPRLVHQHPRILAFGILLLEIGHSKPFQSIPQLNSIAQANCDHKIADNWLKDLKATTWDEFAYKSFFDVAIEYCIREAKLLVDRQDNPSPVGTATDPLTQTLPDNQNGVLKRKERFYKHVVRPLKYLAEIGFNHNIGNTLCIRKKPRVDRLNTDLPNELSLLEESFHSGNTVMPEKWLNDLNSIGRMIARQQRIHKVERAISVAILDTGIYLDDDDSMLPRIKKTRDFVDNSPTKKTDTFGHGSLMAKFVMHCAPSAEIIIARVAKDTKGLGGSQERIRDAILWAGRDCQADIISMSFGFPRDHEGISTAINTVQSERNGSVLFLASAGNSSFEGEKFPARHSSVISIHAANCHGTFMETNPRLPDGAPAIWGTYGSDIPEEFFADIQEKYPNVCRPGSSIATAVAAGISASMVAYADLLPYLEPSAKGNYRLSRLKLLRRKSGMEALFKSMVVKNEGSRMWFLDPISFWRDTSDQDPAKHFARYSKIYSCLQYVNSQQADISQSF
ncbi:uncharacterized protein TRIVIDRAFT_70443 [Trichoderma virens Gv29-8]|uniref:Uncharacterized protein n=1 Tax=Hypocrea virens (strain Gv29-8 / FGSC 10586) TaxID=413071 RepID=G9MVL4_HYPVG|nr:uncharacterized protein TRIVIDRAFT_70443 [Trichoderma virens Gv29-8]EHK21512.1 hypothetical protein TRIVIDRAFT_70443 [Trichoderma virens Gv29-8]